ncbi:MAG TPA: hypothetical protein VFD92_04735 [Candidatus Binatia bacterium]|nr:hypothetical protein [Candidatus Binatia bacterium]
MKRLLTAAALTFALATPALANRAINPYLYDPTGQYQTGYVCERCAARLNALRNLFANADCYPRSCRFKLAAPWMKYKAPNLLFVCRGAMTFDQTFDQNTGHRKREEMTCVQDRNTVDR